MSLLKNPLLGVDRLDWRWYDENLDIQFDLLEEPVRAGYIMRAIHPRPSLQRFDIEGPPSRYAQVTIAYAAIMDSQYHGGVGELLQRAGMMLIDKLFPREVKAEIIRDEPKPLVADAAQLVRLLTSGDT